MRKKKILIPAYQYLWGGGISQVNHILYHLSFLDPVEYEFHVVYFKLSWYKHIKLRAREGIKKMFRNKFEEYQTPERLIKKNMLYTRCKKNFAFILLNDNRGLFSYLANNNFDIIFPVEVSKLNESENFPKQIGFFIDFRHKYYPEQYCAGIPKLIDDGFHQKLGIAHKYFFISKNAKDDAMRYFNIRKDECYVMPFTACFQPYELGILKPVERIEIKKKYFIISNQLYKHKNLLLVIKAMSLLMSEDILLVFTGHVKNMKNPVFRELYNEAMSAGVSERLFFTGFISEEVLFNLINNAVALIQPTLFEGNPGGLSVMNALGIGVPILLSDIPVNREVIGGAVSFFNPYDHSDLATKMKQCLSLASRGESVNAFENLDKIKGFYSDLFSL